MLDPPQLSLAVFLKFKIKGTPYNFIKQLNLTHPDKLCSQHSGGETGKKGKTGKQKSLKIKG